jgi:hypothetical protein
MTSPIVAFDGIAYEVCLYRNGAFVKNVFADHSLSVCVASKFDLMSFQWAQLGVDASGPPGHIYYLCATPHDAGGQCLVRLNDEIEALDLRKAIHIAEDAQSNQSWNPS